MPGDYTRLTFDPMRDRAMVLEQQGRVDLDADSNQFAELVDRRFHIETRDFAGPAVVPATLPDSFKLGVSGSQVTVARGRMYVDGLLAENHGYGNLVYEPVWGEPGYDGPTPLSKQPYGGGSSLATKPPRNRLYYLDVWAREETAVEDSSLLESALGVDTIAAVQTAWQVRWLGIDKGMSCDSDWSTYAPWLAATAPSSGRLSSQAVNPPAPSDPCAVAPIGGYRGLENRLYRVEIHDGGTAGQATLKWSRDNGAVASAVTAIDTSGAQAIITVERLGRDALLRFNQNDWVELLDDAHEYDGSPGLIGQVLQTDSTANTVTLAGAVAAGAIDLTRNPRLRRWDQTTGLVDGVIPLPSLPATIDLEDGVQAVLDLAPAASAGDPEPVFKPGDWWVFAARAATASVETLDAAPPRGIRHHYARLGIVTGNAVTADCRVIFPGDCSCNGDGCDCAACVTPGSHASGALTLQDAVDKVGPAGGRICVAPGRYVLVEPLAIREARSLTIAGAGAATLITYAGEGGCGILVQDSVEVSLERFALAVAVAEPPPPQAKAAGAAAAKPASGLVGVALVNTVDARVERCFVLVGLVPGSGQAARFGAGDLAIGLAGLSLRTRLSENVALAANGIGDMTVARADLLKQEKGDGGVAGVDPAALATTGLAVSYESVGVETGYLLSADLAIVDNLLLAVRVGIDFGAAMAATFTTDATVKPAPTLNLAATRIDRNLILGAGIAGISLLGLGSPEQPPAPPQQVTPPGGVKVPPPSQVCETDAGARQALTWVEATSPALIASVLRAAVEVGADTVVVEDNVIVVAGDGIRATTDALLIRANQIVGPASSSSRLSTGVLLGADRGSSGGRVTVSGNWIREFGLGGVVAAGQVGSLEVASNRIVQTGLVGVAMLGTAVAGEGSIVANTITDLSHSTDDDWPVCAVWMINTTVLRVSGNAIARLAQSTSTGVLCVGIFVAGCPVADVSGNVLTEIGPAGDHRGFVQGISTQGFTTLDVRGNTVALGDSDGKSQDLPLLVGLISGLASVLPQLVLSRTAESVWYATWEPAAEGKQLPLGRPDVGISGNTLTANGSERIVHVNAPVNVTLADNRCRRGQAASETPVVDIATDCRAIVSANRVEWHTLYEPTAPIIKLQVGGGSKPSPELPCTVLGNIANGDITLNGSVLGAPWNQLNVKA